jgi:hypothetical protein
VQTVAHSPEPATALGGSTTTPTPGEAHHLLDDHALADGGVNFDISGVVWGSAVE